MQAEEQDDTADAENLPPLGSQESRPHKNRSRRSTRAHHADNEPDEEEADKTKDQGANQMFRMEDWDEGQPDEDEGGCQVPEVNTAGMQARLSPRRSPTVQEPRRQDEHDSSLSREASAAFWKIMIRSRSWQLTLNNGFAVGHGESSVQHRTGTKEDVHSNQGTCLSVWMPSFLAMQQPLRQVTIRRRKACSPM